MSKADIVLLGKTFSIACAEGQEPHLLKLADQLNTRLEALKDTIGDIGDTRLLIAAGLSLVDDLNEQATTAGSNDSGDLENRITLIERSSATALNDAATRITAIAERIEKAS